MTDLVLGAAEKVFPPGTLVREGADLQGRGQSGQAGKLQGACENHRGLLLDKSRQRLPQVQRQQAKNKGFHVTAVGVW